MQFARLTRYGLLSVTGEDARQFLHAQLTNDIEHLAPDRWVLAGWCSAKGRLLATFLVVPAPEGFLLQLARDLAEPANADEVQWTLQEIRAGPGVQRRHGGRYRALGRRRRATCRRSDLNYYVYYKVDVARLAELRTAVERLFFLLERECGVRGRWMHRRDDPTTYMEVYEDVKDAARFEALLEREGAKLGVQRRLERFVCA